MVEEVGVEDPFVEQEVAEVPEAALAEEPAEEKSVAERVKEKLAAKKQPALPFANRVLAEPQQPAEKGALVVADKTSIGPDGLVSEVSVKADGRTEISLRQPTAEEHKALRAKVEAGSNVHMFSSTLRAALDSSLWEMTAAQRKLVAHLCLELRRAILES